MNEQTRLIVKQGRPEQLAIILESADYEPNWRIAVQQIVVAVFQDAAVLGVTADPPVWDLDPSEISDQITVCTYDGWRIACLPIAPNQTSTLHSAVASTDFQLGTLLLAALPSEDVQRTEAFVQAVRNAGVTGPIATTECFVECADDTLMTIYHFDSATRIRVLTALNAAAAAFTWELVLQNGEGDA